MFTKKIKKKSVGIYLPESIHAEIQTLAKEENISTNQMISDLLKIAINKVKEEGYLNGK